MKMDTIYILYVVPEGEGTFAYRAFDKRANAEFIVRSLKEQYVSKIVTKIIEVDFDGKIMVEGEYQRIVPEGTVIAAKVISPDVPGGLPPRMPDDCPWCHKKTDPHYDTALGVNYWHPSCLKDAYERLSYMNSEEFKATAPPPPDLRLPTGTPVVAPVAATPFATLDEKVKRRMQLEDEQKRLNDAMNAERLQLDNEIKAVSPSAGT